MTRPGLFARPAAAAGIPPIHLSVAPNASRLLRHVQWTLFGIMAIACALAGWWWWNGQVMDDEATRYALAATRTEALNRQLTAQMKQDHLTLTPQEILTIKQDIIFVNQLADKRAFSWTQLLSDMEDALPPATSISKIQLDMKESTATFDGLARHMHDLNALIANLQTRPAFSHPVLHHHTLITAEHASPRHAGGEAVGGLPPIGVEFSLTVTYRHLEPNKGTRS